jgi:hypothetical protein
VQELQGNAWWQKESYLIHDAIIHLCRENLKPRNCTFSKSLIKIKMQKSFHVKHGIEEQQQYP